MAGLSGVGPQRLAALTAAGIHTIEDLLLRLPMRYEDRGRLMPVARLRPGPATVRARIDGVDRKPTRRARFSVLEVRLRDASGTARAVWFNQPFLQRVLTVGRWVVLHGRVEWTGQGPQFVSPDYELTEPPESEDVGLGDGGTSHADSPERIIPVYERLGPLTSKVQRGLMAQALAMVPPALDGFVPPADAAARGLPSLGAALQAVHAPAVDVDQDALAACRTPAQVRLILEEFVRYQLAVADRRRARVRRVKPHRIVVTDAIRDLARAVLPFRLTPGQKTALGEIVADLQRPEPMHRLLQGDVGAGKTLVALLAAIVAMANEARVALMVPTEILALQHAATLTARLANTPYRLALVSGSQRPRERREVLARIAAGEVDLIVGTHALLEDPIDIPRLGLVVVDEQHRFGVAQRATLRAKGNDPDVLVMTATPIPRTLALTACGDLDISTLHGLPPGRTPVKTTVRPSSRADQVYGFVRQQVEAGRQAYVVLPLVEASDKVDARTVVETAEALRNGVLSGLRVAEVHGRLPSADKAAVMEAFVRGDVDVLIATTVIEVGVDVPNATVMVVEHAERFGLAQLHQLRGRVGRGADAAYCVLLYESPLSDVARQRLEAMAATTDGFVIAERDLALRGPGDVLGTRQSGLPTLRVGDPGRDQDLMEEARHIAQQMLEVMPDEDPLRLSAQTGWRRRLALGEVG